MNLEIIHEDEFWRIWRLGNWVHRLNKQTRDHEWEPEGIELDFRRPAVTKLQAHEDFLRLMGSVT